VTEGSVTEGSVTEGSVTEGRGMTQAADEAGRAEAGRGATDVTAADGARLRLARQARGLSQQQLAGVADAGVSSEPAALAYGLDFIPLATERFDLVLPAKHAASREVQGLLKVLTSPWLLAQLASLPGYDPAGCGVLRDQWP
jgi:periplasmic binding family protein